MPDEASSPFVSVIVPMRNERRYIERCLRSLAAQDYPSDRYEVIVIDGSSNDGSREAVESFRSELPNLRVVENRGKHTARGLNIGLAFARGDVIARVDAHAAVEADFLRQSVAALRRTGADVVGGPITTLGEAPSGDTVALAVSSPFGVGNAVFRYSEKEQWTDTVAFPAYRRDVFDRIGPFAEIDGGEDDEFHFRLRDAGGRILLTPAIRSTYYARQTYWELARQYFGYGQAKVVVLSRHPKRTRLRQLVPSAFVLSLIAAFVLTFFGGVFTLPLGILWGGYLAASVAVSFTLARHHGWSHLLRLPVAFICMHIAYGLGFLTGLARRSVGAPVAVPREGGSAVTAVEAAAAPIAPALASGGLYDHLSSAERYIHRTRDETLLAVLRRHGHASLAGRRVLEVGCGEGSFLCSLVHYGVEPALLEGIDLSPDKIAAARRRAPGAALFASDGAALPYRNGVFDLVFAFTFFSSVFDPGVRLRAADEALRVLRPAGLLVVYDFWINPLNSRVRSLHAAELRALFARHRVEMERATLAPPIVRALGGRLPLCRPLERIPFLRSHLLAAVTKES